MALENENNGNGMVMPVQPMGYGGYGGFPMMGGYGGFGNGLFGGDGSWLLLLILLCNGGWGGFGGWGGMMGGMGLGIDFPWLLNGQNQIQASTADGFRTAQLSDGITSVRDGVSNLATQLCGCCGDMQMSIAGVNQNISTTGAGIQQSLCNGFAGVNQAISTTAAQGEIAANGRHSALTNQLYNGEINSLNRSFAEQTANTQGFNGVQAQLAQGFNGVGTGVADLKYTIATENCADRAALSDGIRDLLAATQAQTQTILTQLCNDKIEAKNDTIAQLRQELLYARGQASQDVQTARILAGQTAETDAIYNRLSQCPVGTTPVYGNQPIFTCPGNNFGCGCGAA